MKTEKIFTQPATRLKNTLRNELSNYGYLKEKIHNKSKFLYAEGNAPYMLVAHLDTVHKESPSIICYSQDGNYMMSPQGIGGDDRCGVYIILALIKKLHFRPHIVFTMDEEIGALGAKAFSSYIKSQKCTPELKYIVEFDRKGDNDCVFYDCDNQEFVDFVESFGFKTSWGTFSDISVIAPDLGVAAVNLSSGYYNPHTNHEYVSINDMNNIIDASYHMLCAECNAFEYIEKEYYYDENYNRNNYYSDKISVSFVPEGTIYLCRYYTGDFRKNNDKEIAVDAFGNYYRYSSVYGDLTRLYYEEVVPIEDFGEPIYDAKKARSMSLYY